MSQNPPAHMPAGEDRPPAEGFASNPYAPSSAAAGGDPMAPAPNPYASPSAPASDPYAPSAPSASDPYAPSASGAYAAPASDPSAASDPYAAPSASDPWAAPPAADPWAAPPATGTAAADPYAAPVGAQAQTGAMPSVPTYPAQPYSGVALAGMIAGICSVVLAMICGIGALAAPVGVVLSILGMRDTAGGSKSGRAFAITGLVTSIVGCALLVLGILYIVFVLGLGIWGAASGY